MIIIVTNLSVFRLKSCKTSRINFSHLNNLEAKMTFQAIHCLGSTKIKYHMRYRTCKNLSMLFF